MQDLSHVPYLNTIEFGSDLKDYVQKRLKVIEKFISWASAFEKNPTSISINFY